MKMNILSVSALLALSSVLGGSFAFADGISVSEYFYGAAFFIAKSDCVHLGIQKDEYLELFAEPGAFGINQNQGGNFSPVLNFAVPSQGNYVFDNSVNFPLTNEFKNATLDAKRDEKSGDVTISYAGSSADCVLTACPAYGPCQ